MAQSRNNLLQSLLDLEIDEKEIESQNTFQTDPYYVELGTYAEAKHEIISDPISKMVGERFEGIKQRIASGVSVKEIAKCPSIFKKEIAKNEEEEYDNNVKELLFQEEDDKELKELQPQEKNDNNLNEFISQGNDEGLKKLQSQGKELKELRSQEEEQNPFARVYIPLTSVDDNFAKQLRSKMERDSRSVFIGNVHFLTLKSELKLHFIQFGPIKQVTIVYNKVTHLPRGFAYIQFETRTASILALSLNNSMFKRRRIQVEPKRTNIPEMNSKSPIQHEYMQNIAGAVPYCPVYDTLPTQPIKFENYQL